MATPNVTTAPDFDEDRDRLQNLCDEIQEQIDIQKLRIQEDADHFVDEVKQSFEQKSKEDSDVYLAKILEKMDLERKRALACTTQLQAITRRISDSLQTTFANDNNASDRLKTFRTYLEKIRDLSDSYSVTTEHNSLGNGSDYVLTFDLPLLDFEIDFLNNTTSTVEDVPSQPSPPSSILASSQSSDSLLGWQGDIIQATYNVDLLASDGEHIFYVSYGDDDEHDLIAYHYLNSSSGPDPCRDWKMPRIRDLIWWERIDAFICATDTAVHIVQYVNGIFKIDQKIRGQWPYIRVAAKSDELWIWMNSDSNGFNGIAICDDEFKLLRSIDFDDGRRRPFTNSSTSFCVTDKLTASICLRTKNQRESFQVNFNGFNMINFRTVYVGDDHGGTMIRTDGGDLFFATTGGTKLYTVKPNNAVYFLTLQQNGDALTFVNSDCIVVSGGTPIMEMLTRV